MTPIQSREDLNKARAEALKKRHANEHEFRYQIRVGMSSCGIAVGAQDTLEALNRLIVYENLMDVQFSPIGCIGLCALEPIVIVQRPGRPDVIYGKVTPEVARRIILDHVGNGMIVQENVIEHV